MISIIVPTFNRERTIEKCIKSLLNQTYQDFEILIVDDCSTDDTERVVKKMQDKRIKYIRHTINKGGNAARNTGVSNSTGEFIAFQDSDDEWHSNKLEKQLKALIDTGCDIVSCSHNRFNSNKVEVRPKEFIYDSEIKDKLLCGNFISTQTILGKRECFLKEKFDENLPRFQDWDLVIRLSQQYKIHFINEPLVNVYLEEDSITKDPYKGLIAINRIIDKYKVIIDENMDSKCYFYRMLAFYSKKSNKYSENYYFKAWKCKKNNISLIIKAMYFELKSLKK